MGLASDGVDKIKRESDTDLDILVGRANAFLDGPERLRVPHLAQLVGDARREATQDRGGLLRRRFYHRFRFLVSTGKVLSLIMNAIKFGHDFFSTDNLEMVVRN